MQSLGNYKGENIRLNWSSTNWH